MSVAHVYNECHALCMLFAHVLPHTDGFMAALPASRCGLVTCVLRLWTRGESVGNEAEKDRNRSQ